MKYGQFCIITRCNTFKKGDLLDYTMGDDETYTLRIVKTYPFNFWRRLLFVLGFKITPDTTIKVEFVDDEDEG